MCKIVGFTNRVDGYQTTAGKMNSDLFQNACKGTAKVTGKPLNELLTKRQCGKFFSGKGLVYKTITS